MKKIILITIATLAFTIAEKQTYAQDPEWLWAESAGETDWDDAYSVATDAAGNVYVTGYFSSPFITFGSTVLTNAGYYDIFITKYDSNGTVLWAKSAGGTDYDYAISISTDASGNVYVTGSYESSSITFGSTTLTNAGGGDMFLTKYDSNGNVLWAKGAGGDYYDYGSGVSTDADGNVYLTGRFDGWVTFDSTVLVGIFITKYDSNGNVLWVKTAGGDYIDSASDVSTDTRGNVYVTGYFSGSIIFGTNVLTNPYGNSYDIFITKYDSNGNVLWAKSAGGTDYDYAFSISTDASGNVYVTGYFKSPSITFGSTTLTNAGSSDMFITKYDTNGTVLWAKSAVGGDDDDAYSAYDVSTDADENVYVAGDFWGSSITFGSTTLTNAGGFDIFIAKYDSNGTVLWAKSAGGTDYERAFAVSTDASGNVYVTGFFGSPSITLGSTTLTNAGEEDIFIAKLGDSIQMANCNMPASLSSINITPTMASLQWDAVPGTIGYRVRYKAVETSQWILTSSTTNELTITGLTPNTKYTWKVRTVCSQSPEIYSDSFAQSKFTTAPMKLGTGYESIFEVYPNPISQSATVSFSLNEASSVVIQIRDVNGRSLRVIAEENFSEGNHEITFNRESLSGGIYFLRMETNGKVIMKKMIVE